MRRWLFPEGMSFGRTVLGRSGHVLSRLIRPLSLARKSGKPIKNNRPMRMAVIGSGPAGFYTAHRVLALMAGAKVDMYEALPVPYGLVRFGVAPDHPEVKDCQTKFEQVASAPDFTFIGNVAISSQPGGRTDGASVPLAALRNHYDAVVFAYGASEDRRLGIRGESLNGIYSAREFVGWYNGLPECAGLNPVLSLGKSAVIVGQGNVAVDVARILLRGVDDPDLRHTDMPEHVLDALSRSAVRKVHVVGRRGPMQAAFTIKELRELMRLPRLWFQPVDRDLVPPNLDALPRVPRRLMQLLVQGPGLRPSDTTKACALRFCLTPVEFLPEVYNARKGWDGDASRVAALHFKENDLVPSPFEPDARPVVRDTPKVHTFEAPLIVRAIGYHSVPLPCMEDLLISFDTQRGVVRNDGRGRVLLEGRPAQTEAQWHRNPGLYCTGWVGTGATGVINSTMVDAFTTAESITEDWQCGKPFLQGSDRVRAPHGWEGVKSEFAKDIEKARVVHWEDWQTIDQAERQRGKQKAKPREKFVTTKDMLEVLG